MAVGRVTPSVPNQNWFLSSPGQIFSFYASTLKKPTVCVIETHSHRNVFNPKRPAKRTARSLIWTLKQVFVLIKQSTYAHWKHKVNVHTLLSPQKPEHASPAWGRHSQTFKLNFTNSWEHVFALVLTAKRQRFKQAYPYIHPSNTHSQPGFCRSGISRTDSIFPETRYVCLAFQ